MHVKVRLYASLRGAHLPEEEMDVSAGTTVASIIEMLGLHPPSVTLVFINGRHGAFESQIHEGDEVALFPPVGGG